MTTSARANPRLALAAGGGEGGDGGGIEMTPKLREAIRLLRLTRAELLAAIQKEFDSTSTG